MEYIGMMHREHSLTLGCHNDHASREI
jgi:hypothetical protein